MSDSGTFTMQDVMNLKRQMDLARAVRGYGNPQPMDEIQRPPDGSRPMDEIQRGPQQMMPATLNGGQGTNPQTPYAGLANAGNSIGNAMMMNNYQKRMGQMLQGLPQGSMSAQGFPDPNAGLLTRTQNYLGGLFNGG